MGVGGNFWDLLKPYARFEGVDFLRDKRVAVDLSFWVVQHDAAIRSKYPGARNPHLRITFFRTLALFAKFGAFPVFVVDGEPSPLKDQARMERFLRGSGLELSVLVKPPEAAAGHAAPAVKQRNRVFSAWVQECVELLEILGMPVLKAQSEAEALCGHLNNEGHVDACITSDSDAFLFGAKCVIKCLRSNSKEPFECYYLSDIEAGLGLKRKQMVAIALLVGNDHDLQGVPGFGVETALRFVKLFSDDDILDWLSEVGKGIIPAFLECMEASLDPDTPSPFEGVAARSPHCSQCGHPGNKRAHLKIACEYCIYNGSESCIMKSSGFKCFCSGCSKDRVIKEQKKQENWQFKACQRIAAEHGFPNKEIIEMYLNASSHDNEGSCGQLLRWDKPRVENLVDFLAFHQHWEPSYIRQRILPMLSTIFLREMASKPEEGSLLYDQYEFHSIERVKIRYSHPYYLVKWKKAVHGVDYVIRNISSNEELESEPTESTIADESVDSMDGPDVPTILVDDGCWYLVTEENTELVRAAFPKAVEKFLQEKQVKETKSSPRKSSKSKADSESPKSSGVQLSITEFYRSTKPATGAIQAKDKQLDLEAGESGKSRSRPATLDQVIPKSVRRRLLFD